MIQHTHTACIVCARLLRRRVHDLTMDKEQFYAILLTIYVKISPTVTCLLFVCLQLMFDKFSFILPF